MHVHGRRHPGAVLTAPIVIVWMATLGLVAYVQAHRAGVDHSDCRLRDPLLVIGYLAFEWLAGAWFTIQELMDWINGLHDWHEVPRTPGLDPLAWRSSVTAVPLG